jgi:surface carbohydrate biosynthesis protein
LARDLEGHVLVAFQIERRHGYEVQLCFGETLEEELLAAAPDAFVLDYLGWEARVRVARLARELGIRVAMMPTAGFFQDVDRELRRAGQLLDSASLADFHLTWGEAGRDLLVREQLAPEGRAHAVGCPRFDFYRDPFLSLMGSRPELLERLGVSDADRPLIVWTTNTYFAHRRDGRKEVRKQARQARRPAAELEAEIEDSFNQFREHSRIVENLAVRHPDWNFLVKVHPFESAEPYNAMADRVPNLHVADLPVRQVLFHGDVVLQRGCTTATEAWMLGKPVLELTMGQYHHPIRADYLQGNELVQDLESTERAIHRALAGGALSAEQERARETFLREVYYRIDGRAAERCADRIAELVAPPAYSDADRERVRDVTRQARNQWQARENGRLANRIKDSLGVDRRTSLRFWKQLGRRIASPSSAAAIDYDVAERAREVERLYRLYAEIFERAEGSVTTEPRERAAVPEAPAETLVQ